MELYKGKFPSLFFKDTGLNFPEKHRQLLYLVLLHCVIHCTSPKPERSLNQTALAAAAAEVQNSDAYAGGSCITVLAHGTSRWKQGSQCAHERGEQLLLLSLSVLSSSY